MIRLHDQRVLTHTKGEGGEKVLVELYEGCVELMKVPATERLAS